MRHTPRFLMTDPDEVKRLVRQHPWATFVSPASTGLVASHYPVMVEDGDGDGITLVSHFGRPDETLHELGQHEILVIVQGPHDYVSPSWYAPGDLVPTWNHVTAHLYGTPEILSDDENYAVLTRLTDHFEHGRPGGRSLDEDEEGTRRIAKRNRRAPPARHAVRRPGQAQPEQAARRRPERDRPPRAHQPRPRGRDAPGARELTSRPTVRAAGTGLAWTSR